MKTNRQPSKSIPFQLKGLSKFINFSLASLIGAMSLSISARAAQIKSHTIKHKAFFVPAEDDELYRPLNLIFRKVQFTHSDRTRCENQMIRLKSHFVYACTLHIDSRAEIAKLRQQLSPSLIRVPFGDSLKTVFVKVSDDGKKVTFSTEFDKTGIDFEFQEYNEDFFQVYKNMASQIIGMAMAKVPLRLQILEST